MKQSGFPEFWLRSDMQLRCRVLEGGLEAFEHGGGHRGGGGRAARPADLWDTEFGEQRVSSAYRGPLINGGPSNPLLAANGRGLLPSLAKFKSSSLEKPA